MVTAILLYCGTEGATSSIKEILTTIAPFASSIALAYVGFQYAIRQLKKESIENVQRKKYDYILEAHKQIYQLLAYTTDTENAKSILLWERTGSGANKIDTYFLRKENAEAFLQELPTQFYGNGHGLFLDPEINELLFEYRNHIYGILLKTKNETESTIKLDNPELVKKLKVIHQDLSVKIREKIKLETRNLTQL